ncbi:aminotransferase class V-fold PLP-dependent enzyme [Enterococcus sp. 669A]|uniref:cysteine desulfurase n=1 Tax=Candidatus Enterococcus moelleringii TaxID=2815325 RepID=A0ABS3L961_9ENTE|nr:aminotransferase class V-fold PLP-dependent enzyme [Enterococcus sp. 669A]MBO1306156.1 aminotransferase class V-fold PLP-dependent enzyme [Enterococcus sp. 669A]
MSFYFDNGATTIHKPKVVAEKVAEVLSADSYGNPSRGAHLYSLQAYQVVAEARESLKKLFRATDKYEVAFTNNATVALNEVLKGVIQPGDHVLTTSWEHNSVLRPLYQLEQAGATLDFVSSDPVTGRLNYLEFEEKLRPETKVVVCNHASNVTGNVLDLDWVKVFCRRYDLLLILDISQTAGVLPIDLSDEQIVAVCFTGHKSLYGPQGTGGVCVRKDVDIEPVLTGGDGMRSFSKTQPKELPTLLEAGTVNVPGIAGLGAAVDWGMENPASGQEELGRYFVEQLKEMPDITLYGDFAGARVNVFSLNIADADSALVSDLLWEDYEIATRPGYHCAPLMHEALGTAERGTVRFSFSRFTTREEVDQVLRALRELTERK